MQANRVVAVQSPAGLGSGYVIAPRLVLTSAHTTGEVDTLAMVCAAGESGACSGRVVWRGTPGGRDDAALVAVDDPAWLPRAGAPPRWGRVVTNRPGIACQAWGFPRWAQRPGRAAETWQPSGTLNPGNRYVGDRYVLSLTSHPPAPADDGGSLWAGLSGAALFCGDLLTGVVAADAAGGQHAHLEAVPAYVLHRDPAFRHALADRGVADMVLEPVEAQELVEAEIPVGRSPAALLRAGQQVVGFRGRGQLLESLLAWSLRPGFAAWLLYGPGGQGKTRLARELAGRLAADRWATLWLRRDTPTGALRVLADAAVPLLVIIDYAETRTGQITAALRECARHGGDVPLRMLLLARTAGDWWDTLQAAAPHAEALLDGAPGVRLPELEREPAGRAEAYQQAVVDLARAMAGLPGRQHHDWGSISSRVTAATPDLGRPVSALTLHMTALADLLGAAEPAPADSAAEPEPVEDRLLRHERRYWQATATARGLRPGLAESTLFDALAAAMLLGADHRDDADVLLRCLPALHDQTRDRRDAVRAWIEALYPPRDARQWGSLQPDRLAERFIGTRLAATPDLVDPLLAAATITPTQVDQLLTVYARAAHHLAFGGRLDAQLTGLCVRYRDILALPAIDIATQVEAPGPLIAALRQLTTAPDISLDTLATMADRLPRASHNLAEWAAELAQRLVDEHRRLAADDPDAFLPNLAMSLNNLSVRLAELGRREPALAAIEEAVEVYRALAAARPDTFLPHLATSLNNLSVRLADLGRREPPLTAIEEVVEVYQAVAAARLNAFLPELAGSLNNLSAMLGRRGPALAAIEEAVSIRRALAAARPEEFVPDLAGSLNNLSVRLAELGRRGPALAAIEEAVEVYRALAAARSDAFLPNLATSLNNLSLRLAELGRRGPALAAIEEAVSIRRALVAARPDAFLPNLATSLNNLSLRLAELGRREPALAAIEEAVSIRRRLVALRPDAHQPELDQSVEVLAWLTDLEDER